MVIEYSDDRLTSQHFLRIFSTKRVNLTVVNLDAGCIF